MSNTLSKMKSDLASISKETSAATSTYPHAELHIDILRLRLMSISNPFEITQCHLKICEAYLQQGKVIEASQAELDAEKSIDSLLANKEPTKELSKALTKEPSLDFETLISHITKVAEDFLEQDAGKIALILHSKVKLLYNNKITPTNSFMSVLNELYICNTMLKLGDSKAAAEVAKIVCDASQTKDPESCSKITEELRKKLHNLFKGCSDGFSKHKMHQEALLLLERALSFADPLNQIERLHHHLDICNIYLKLDNLPLAKLSAAKLLEESEKIVYKSGQEATYQILAENLTLCIRTFGNKKAWEEVANLLEAAAMFSSASRDIFEILDTNMLYCLLYAHLEQWDKAIHTANKILEGNLPCHQRIITMNTCASITYLFLSKAGKLEIKDAALALLLLETSAKLDQAFHINPIQNQIFRCREYLRLKNMVLASKAASELLQEMQKLEHFPRNKGKINARLLGQIRDLASQFYNYDTTKLTQIDTLLLQQKCLDISAIILRDDYETVVSYLLICRSHCVLKQKSEAYAAARKALSISKKLQSIVIMNCESLTSHFFICGEALLRFFDNDKTRNEIVLTLWNQVHLLSKIAQYKSGIVTSLIKIAHVQVSHLELEKAKNTVQELEKELGSLSKIELDSKTSNYICKSFPHVGDIFLTKAAFFEAKLLFERSLAFGTPNSIGASIEEKIRYCDAINLSRPAEILTIAGILLKLQYFTAARVLYQRAIDLGQFAPDNLTIIALSYACISLCFCKETNMTLAIKAAKEALEASKKIYCNERELPEINELKNIFKEVLKMFHGNQEAEEANIIVALNQKIFELSNPKVKANYYADLSNVLNALLKFKQYGEALRIAKQLLSVLDTINGEDRLNNDMLIHNIKMDARMVLANESNLPDFFHMALEFFKRAIRLGMPQAIISIGLAAHYYKNWEQRSHFISKALEESLGISYSPSRASYCRELSSAFSHHATALQSMDKNHKNYKSIQNCYIRSLELLPPNEELNALLIKIKKLEGDNISELKTTISAKLELIGHLLFATKGETPSSHIVKLYEAAYQVDQRPKLLDSLLTLRAWPEIAANLRNRIQNSGSKPMFTCTRDFISNIEKAIQDFGAHKNEPLIDVFMLLGIAYINNPKAQNPLLQKPGFSPYLEELTESLNRMAQIAMNSTVDFSMLPRALTDMVNLLARDENLKAIPQSTLLGAINQRIPALKEYDPNALQDWHLKTADLLTIQFAKTFRARHQFSSRHRGSEFLQMSEILAKLLFKKRGASLLSRAARLLLGFELENLGKTLEYRQYIERSIFLDKLGLAIDNALKDESFLNETFRKIVLAACEKVKLLAKNTALFIPTRSLHAVLVNNYAELFYLNKSWMFQFYRKRVLEHASDTLANLLFKKYESLRTQVFTRLAFTSLDDKLMDSPFSKPLLDFTIYSTEFDNLDVSSSSTDAILIGKLCTLTRGDANSVCAALQKLPSKENESESSSTPKNAASQTFIKKMSMDTSDDLSFQKSSSASEAGMEADAIKNKPKRERPEEKAEINDEDSSSKESALKRRKFK